MIKQHEDLTELGKQVLAGKPGVLTRVLREVLPATFSVGPDSFEELWTLSSPDARVMYAKRLQKMCVEAGMVWTDGGWEHE